MTRIDSHTEALIDFLADEAHEPDVLLSIVSLILIAGWFLREIFGLFPLGDPTLDLLYNIAVLFFAMASLKVNYDRYDPVLRIREQMVSRFSYREDRWVAVIVAVFLIQMVAIAFWDIPFDYHPGDDEYIVPSMYFSQFDVSAAISNPNTSQNPLYDNQHLMYYVLTPFFLLLRVFGALDQVHHYFLAARALNYVFAVLIIMVTYASAKEAFGRTAAIVAASLFPLTRQFAHFSLFMRSDVILTLLVSVLFAAYLGLVGGVRGRPGQRSYLLPGILLGLGLALKPYALIFALPFLLRIVHDLWRDGGYRRAVFQASQLLTPLLVAFHFGRFYHTYMVRRLGAGFGTALAEAGGTHALYPEPGGLIERLAFTVTLHGWWNGLTHIALLLTGLVIVSYLLLRRDYDGVGPQSIILFTVPFGLFMGVQVLTSGRYFLPILPMMFVAVGGSFVFLYGNRRPILRTVVVILLVGALVQPVLVTGAWASALTREDPRTETTEWITDNVEDGSDVSYLAFPSWQKPRLPRERYDVHALDDDTDYLVVATSSYHRVHYYHSEGYSMERIGRYVDHPVRAVSVTRQVFGDGRTLTVDGQTYRQVANFRKDQRFLGYRHYDYHPYPASWDVWAITNPMEVRVYERVG